MRLQAISNIIFLATVFTYQVIGDHYSIRWGNIFYISLYLYMFIANIDFYKRSIIAMHRYVMAAGMFYFGFSLLTEISCFIWPSLYGTFIANTHLVLSGTGLMFIMFSILTYKSTRQ